jgi:hypothetical protein
MLEIKLKNLHQNKIISWWIILDGKWRFSLKSIISIYIILINSIEDTKINIIQIFKRIIKKIKYSNQYKPLFIQILF